jgi:hypothetical protein
LIKPEDLWEKNVIENLLNDRDKVKKIIKNGYITSKKYNIENITRELEKIYFPI